MSAIQAAHHSSIGIFLRVKPVARPSAGLAVDETDHQINFTLPKALSVGYGLTGFCGKQSQTKLTLTVLFRPVNNQRENYQFTFNGVLTAAAKQEEVCPGHCLHQLGHPYSLSMVVRSPLFFHGYSMPRTCCHCVAEAAKSALSPTQHECLWHDRSDPL